MTDLPPIIPNFKKKTRRPAEPPRQPVRDCSDFPAYRLARARSISEPGPATDADTKGALAFAQDMPPDIAAVYYADLRRR